jgi:glycosyltransferase involved in cell wall biosynthesis
MNLQFCLWLWSIRRTGLKVMFHEVAFPVSAAQPFRHNLLGAVTSIMAWLVCRSAALIMVASERWAAMLSRYGATAPILWVPVPSNIPVIVDPIARERWRRSYSVANGPLIGHFANYCDYSVRRLSQVVPALLDQHRGLSVLLLGANSVELRSRLLSSNRHLADRVHSTGAVTAAEISAGLDACDLMVQPYPDGVSTRRSSTSALLAHGCAMVTTAGISTEQLWRDTGAVITVPVDAPDRLRAELSRMITNDEMRSEQGRAAKALYQDRFAVHHTIAALTSN